MIYKISQLSNSDLQDIELFFKQVYIGNIDYGSEKIFSWKIFKNPASTGIINAVIFKDKIVSTTTLTPKSLFINKIQIPAAEIGDTYTKAEYQRKGLFVTLVDKTIKDGLSCGIMHIYGTPNHNSLPGYLKKCDFVTIDFLNVSSYTLILNLKSLFTNQPFIQLILSLFNPFYQFFLKVFFKIKSRKISVEELKVFDPSFDRIWQQSLNNYNYIFNRDIDYLNWRFNDSPYDYRKFAIKSDSNTVGYIIIRENTKNKIVYIADYLCQKQYTKKFCSVLAALSENSLVSGYNKISAWISSTDFLLKEFKLNFFIKSSNIPVITFKGTNDSVFSDNIKYCHFTLSDSDNI